MMEKDGAYSWIVLVTIAINNIFVPGYALSSVGVFADVYPELLGLDPSQTNIIGSTQLAVILFSGAQVVLFSIYYHSFLKINALFIIENSIMLIVMVLVKKSCL